jgi:predicted type IV restriction endonuclease
MCLKIERYLDYGSVRNGTAYEAARTDLQDVAKEREIQRTLPDAWHQLISDGDDLLLDLVAEKVESMCGYKPSHDTVASFLKGGAQPLPSMVQTSSQSMIPARRASLPRGAKEAARDSSAPLSVEFLGEVYSASKQRDILLKTLQMMATRDPTFPERFAASKSGERSRRRLARSRLDLYPSNPRLAEEKAHSRELMPGSGWWVDLHMDWPATMKFIKEACAIAGLEFGVDVKLHMT